MHRCEPCCYVTDIGHNSMLFLFCKKNVYANDMFTYIIDTLTHFITQVISATGYIGVALLMGIESAAIPLPSEIIMPFAGFLVSEGRFSLWGVAMAGAIGSMVGSFVTYEIGAIGGRKLVERYGKYVLISEHDLALADKFFARFGLFATFIGRMLPVVRTFISVPAGISRVKRVPFFIYSFIGSYIWSYTLAYFGYKLGPAWATLRERVHGFDTAVVLLIIAGVLWWVWRHFKNRKE